MELNLKSKSEPEYIFKKKFPNSIELLMIFQEKSSKVQFINKFPKIVHSKK